LKAYTKLLKKVMFEHTDARLADGQLAMDIARALSLVCVFLSLSASSYSPKISMMLVQ
jgi:hypothetical protein